MGAPRARRWKLLLPPFHSAKRKPPLPPPPPAPVAVAPAPGKEEEEEVMPEEFLCPISGAPMADPVILPPGRTYERACVDACAGLSLCPPGASAATAAAIPNGAPPRGACGCGEDNDGGGDGAREVVVQPVVLLPGVRRVHVFVRVVVGDGYGGGPAREGGGGVAGR